MKKDEMTFKELCLSLFEHHADTIKYASKKMIFMFAFELGAAAAVAKLQSIPEEQKEPTNE